MKQKLYERLVEYIIENQNKFYRLAYSYVKNEEDALDVVQNAVCKALEKSDSLRNENAIKTWVYTIIVNESMNVLNEKKRIILSQDDQIPDPGYEEKGYELFDDMHEKISRLPEEEQTIIRLRFFEELSLEEISIILKMNLSTVKSKLYRGLKKLKVIVEEGEAL